MDNVSLKELALTEEHAYTTLPERPPGTRPAREKAIITIGRQIGKQSIKLGVNIVLADEYAHGSTDLVELSSAMELFRKAAGQQAAEICRSEGIVLLNKSHAAQESQTSSTSTFTKQQPASLPYVPASIRMFGDRESSYTRFCSMFLEGVRWLRVESPESENKGTVEVILHRADGFMTCARQVSRSLGLPHIATNKEFHHHSFRKL